MDDCQRDDLVTRLREVRRKARTSRQYTIAHTEIMTRIKIHYDLRVHAVDKLKELILDKEPSTQFEDVLTTEIINTSQYHERIGKDVPYRFTPDDHDERMALVLWDLYRLPREHALTRMGIKTCEGI